MLEKENKLHKKLHIIMSEFSIKELVAAVIGQAAATGDDKWVLQLLLVYKECVKNEKKSKSL